MAHKNNTAVRRMIHDIRVVKKENLYQQGIFIDVERSNPFHVRAVIHGQEGPYAFGYYLFDLVFPKDTYPHAPPKVTYETRSGKIRFNPNLYCCGKVCLSILNTWQGPQWTSCQSLKSVLFALQQVLMGGTPLHNEPGYERMKPSHPLCVRYNLIVQHSNFSVAILKMFDCPPDGFEAFLPVMRDLFIKNVPHILKSLQALVEEHPEPRTVECKVYGGKTVIDFPKQLDDITTLAALLQSSGADPAPDHPSTNVVTDDGGDAVSQDLLPDTTAPVAPEKTATPAKNPPVLVPTVAAAAATPTDVATTSAATGVEYEAPPPSKKTKRVYYRKMRPETKANTHELGYSEPVYDTHLQKMFVWQVVLDKRGAKVWKRAITSELILNAVSNVAVQT